MKVIVEIDETATITRLTALTHTIELFWKDVVSKYHVMSNQENLIWARILAEKQGQIKPKGLDELV